MLRLRSLISRIAPSRKAVLITGPTGSGKELVVRSLHEQSLFSEGPMINVNCSTLPESLTESLLFGHEKGSFTGADKKHNGYFAQADNGTLFLDELGEMPLAMQAKLLRVLETGRYSRVGGSAEHSFTGRVVAATHVDLKEAIKRREFREDLYFRLNVLMIETTSLNDRREDIPLLIEHFRAVSERPIPLSPAAIHKLQYMDWQGNIRELKNAVERLCLLAEHELITEETISALIQKETVDQQEYFDQIAKMILESNVSDKKRAINDALLVRALKQTKGNKSEAAKLLGVHRKVVERRYFSYIKSSEKKVSNRGHI